MAKKAAKRRSAKTIKINCKGSGLCELKKLKVIQGELKTLSPENEAKLRKRIEQYGFDAPFFVWKNKILDGTQRKIVLQKMIDDGWKLPGGKVPVCEIKAKNLNDAKQRLLGYVSQYGKLDSSGLDVFLKGIEVPDLGTIDLPDFDFEKFMRPPKQGLTDPDAVPDPPKKPKAKTGDLYLLGDHRLLCGDSTKAEDVERVMNGEKADMVFTDPPYGIDVVANSPRLREDKKLGTIGGSVLARVGKYKAVENDDNTNAARSSISLFPGVDLMIWGGNYFTDFLEPSRGWIVWDKRNGGTTFADCELCYTSFDRSVRLYQYLWSGMRREGGRLEEGKLRWHPTQKPVGLTSTIITEWANEKRVIVDPFLGSGTTLIAAEKLDRKCYGLEIDPVYCDVIVKRWEDFTGKKAKRVRGKRG